jgi:hypothetical protein
MLSKFLLSIAISLGCAAIYFSGLTLAQQHGHRAPTPAYHKHAGGPAKFNHKGQSLWRYPKGNHPKWGHHRFSNRYGCNVYWHPHHNCYYYWCAPHECYYPVSYCPFGTYVFQETVTYPAIPVAPVEQAVPVAPVCPCGPSCPCRGGFAPSPVPRPLP